MNVLSKFFIFLGLDQVMATEQVDPQAIVDQYQRLRNECQGYGQKISELASEKHEHSLVIDAIKPLDPGRKCYRMIGGVLVERTTGEVLPVIEKNAEQLEGVIAQLTKELEKKEKEAADFAIKYKISVKRENEGPPAPRSENSSNAQESDSSTGVLV